MKAERLNRIIAAIDSQRIIEPRFKASLWIVDRKSNPSPFAEIEAVRFASILKRKQTERTSPLVESPFFPGIFFRKSGTVMRIERENAEPWENVVDYLIRRYRTDQVGIKSLAIECEINKRTMMNTLLRLGVPHLRSTEYRDARMGAQVAVWEDKEKRQLRSKRMKDAWDSDKKARVKKINSPGARAKKIRAITKWHQDNPDTIGKHLALARKRKEEAQNNAEMFEGVD